MTEAAGGRLGSTDRADHPHAADEQCSIGKPHPQHPYGRIHDLGGLTYYCKGKP